MVGSQSQFSICILFGVSCHMSLENRCNELSGELQGSSVKHSRCRGVTFFFNRCCFVCSFFIYFTVKSHSQIREKNSACLRQRKLNPVIYSCPSPPRPSSPAKITFIDFESTHTCCTFIFGKTPEQPEYDCTKITMIRLYPDVGSSTFDFLMVRDHQNVTGS